VQKNNMPWIFAVLIGGLLLAGIAYRLTMPGPTEAPPSVAATSEGNGQAVPLAAIASAIETQPTASPSAQIDPASANTPVVRSNTPSFSCGAAVHYAERQICASPDLAAADRQLATLFFSTRARSAGGKRAALQQSQRSWLEYRNACRDNGCLEQAYLSRISELENW
jgi:uncharacterized protein YecT (DUF1311 family)